MYDIVQVNRELKQKAADFIADSWGSPVIVSRGKVHTIEDTQGYAVVIQGDIKCLITYRIENDECEIICLESRIENQGIGSRLIEKVIETARKEKCQRVWLITTNDNTKAIYFYQKRGFSLVCVHLNAVCKSRELKPQIPYYGNDGIPILHEIEFEIKLKPADNGEDKIYSITGGLELLPSVKPLWEGLREHHSKVSRDFSESLLKQSFEDRAAGLENKSDDHVFRIELIMVNEAEPPVGYCISSVSNLSGEIESIYIKESYRRMHIGDLLMKNALRWMDEQNVRVKRIGVVAGNDVLEFYGKYGFKVRTHILEQVDKNYKNFN